MPQIDIKIHATESPKNAQKRIKINMSIRGKKVVDYHLTPEEDAALQRIAGRILDAVSSDVYAPFGPSADPRAK